MTEEDTNCDSAERGTRQLVLIVDDAPMDRHLAGRVVEKDPALKAIYASNGDAALKKIECDAPSAVVTDLQMPVMDGLELVETIRLRYPQIPVILMTGHGSEEIAIRALQRGAASYVAKRFLAQDLGPTIQQVMNAAKSDRRKQQILDSMTALECEFTLENDPSLVPMVVSYFQDHVGRLGICDESQRMRVGIALEESLLNGLFHGNLELNSDLRQDGGDAFLKLGMMRSEQVPFKNRKLHIRAKIGAEEAAFVVRDEGPGFDPSSLPDPTIPENLEKASGRGLLLIRTFMDSVSHNATGNEITLIKRKSAGNSNDQAQGS